MRDFFFKSSKMAYIIEKLKTAQGFQKTTIRRFIIWYLLILYMEGGET